MTSMAFGNFVSLVFSVLVTYFGDWDIYSDSDDSTDYLYEVM